MGGENRETVAGIPRVSRWLLARCLHGEDRRFALADLEEEFEDAASRHGPRQARAQYRRQAWASMGPALRGRLARRTTAGSAVSDRSLLLDAVADVKMSARSFAKTPFVFVVTVFSLGAGIGASSLAFALFRSVVYPAPVGIEAPERLVTLYRGNPAGGLHGYHAWVDLDELRSAIPLIEDVAGATIVSASIEGTFGRHTLLGEEVTPNYLELMGIQAIVGRVFTEAETRGGDTRVAVLGYGAWQRIFEGDPGAVGQVVRLAGVAFTIVGVAPEGVRSRLVPFPSDLWVPVGSLSPGGVVTTQTRDPAQRGFLTLARMRPDATLDQVQASASLVAARLHAARPELWTDDAGRAQPVTVVSEADSRVRPELRTGGTLIGAFFLLAAALVLAVACSNVAGLFLARARQRRAEIALRRSLGATRSRLVRMMLAEGILPGVLAGALGVGLTYLGTDLIGGLTLPVDVPLRLDADVDGVVLTTTFLLTLVASLTFSLVPALEGARVDLHSALKRAREGSSRSARSRFKDGLVVAQCAATAILLFGSSLFLRTLDVATTVDLGFDPTGIAVASRDISARDLTSRDGAQFVRSLRDRLGRHEAVESVALSRSLELTLYQMGTDVSVAPGVDPAPDELTDAWRNAVTPGYIEMMDIPVIAGRSLDESDHEDSEPVAVVNETFVQHHWPSEDPLGRVFSIREGTELRAYRVVGVVRDGTYRDFDDPPTPFVFTSLYQDFTPRFAIAIEGRTTAEALLPLLRGELQLDDGEVQMVGPSVLADQVSFQFMHLRIATVVLGWGGVFGLFLAAMGLYGVVAYAVTQRAREMALRVALGAERGSVTTAIAREGLVLAAIGVAVGIVFVMWIARFGEGVLFGVRATDPFAMGGTLVILLLVTLVATIVPARQILRVDPMEVLGRE